MKGVKNWSQRANGLGRMRFETHTFSGLKRSKDRKQVFGPWIAVRTQHAHQAFRRLSKLPAEYRKSDGRIDHVAQQHLAHGDVATEQLIDGFLKHGAPELRIGLRTLNHCLFKFSRQCHRATSPLSIFMVPPECFGVCDICRLTLLATTDQQDHERVSFFAEVNPVTRAKMQAVLKHTATQTLDVSSPAHLKTGKCNTDANSGLRVEVLEPACKWALAMFIKIFTQLRHFDSIAHVTIQNGLSRLPTLRNTKIGGSHEFPLA